MTNSKVNETTTFTKCIEFLNGIGIKTIFREIGPNSFLPGFLIENGAIIIDSYNVQQPGDILHEAGHMAVVSAAERPKLTGASIMKRKNREAEEVMAIAWSYAACVYLQIDPCFVFHEEGYRSGSDYIIDSCDNGTYLGVAMLQGIEMVGDNTVANHRDVSDYPNLTKWLRE